MLRTRYRGATRNGFPFMTDGSAFCTTRLPSTIVHALSLSLSACTRSTDFPVDQTETLVTQGLDARCGLATIVSREELPAVDGLKRVAVHCEANCVPDGGDIPHRVKAVMTFSQSHGSFGARPWTKAGNHYEPDPPVASVAAPALREVVAASAANAWSDAPECNAALTRVAAEVLPCLDKASPESAQQMRGWMERAREEYRVLGDVSQRAAALLVIDENCLQQWRYRNKMLADDSTMRSCSLR
jgi:hypothetical protein